MASCSFSALVGGLCGPSTSSSSNTNCVTIGGCTKDIKGHLVFCKISDDASLNESTLILARAGKRLHSLRLSVCLLYL